jgi:diguanylate cyclase (GGDEF)-like protein
MDPLRGFQVATDDVFERLQPKAVVDPLTGLTNRSVFVDSLNVALFQAKLRQRNVVVMYLDLDGFKSINDIHGREEGDRLLVTISRRMLACLSETDILARIGGDEFVIALTDLEYGHDHQRTVDKLLLAAAAPVGLHQLTVSAGVGITIWPSDNSDADQLIRHALQAMYESKQLDNTNFHVFDVCRETERRKHRANLERIRTSLDRDFVLFYQPKVNMRSGQVIGLEALIRWNHPEEGLLQPSAFLPFIADHPISIELGQWVIEAALAQMNVWRRIGLNLCVSVNIGAIQLQHPDFCTRLQQSLSLFPDVSPSNLELEILETSSIDDIASVSAIMQACRALGVSFALDDFGTGYSSLTYLQRLPSELIKIDQSFIRNMLSSSNDLSIVKGVIGLAEAFKLDVIAEGVETLEHGSKLLSLGCHLAQGYGISRPMAASSVPGWLRDWKMPDIWKLA